MTERGLESKLKKFSQNENKYKRISLNENKYKKLSQQETKFKKVSQNEVKKKDLPQSETKSKGLSQCKMVSPSMSLSTYLLLSIKETIKNGLQSGFSVSITKALCKNELKNLSLNKKKSRKLPLIRAMDMTKEMVVDLGNWPVKKQVLVWTMCATKEMVKKSLRSGVTGHFELLSWECHQNKNRRYMDDDLPSAATIWPVEMARCDMCASA